MIYLCMCYPDYNLFTLKRLIPIEINALHCEVRGIFLLFYTSFVEGSGITGCILKMVVIGVSKIVSA